MQRFNIDKIMVCVKLKAIIGVNPDYTATTSQDSVTIKKASIYIFLIYILFEGPPRLGNGESFKLLAVSFVLPSGFSMPIHRDLRYRIVQMARPNSLRTWPFGALFVVSPQAFLQNMV
jgi:hypothetical protein